MARLALDQAEGLRRLFVEDVRRMIALVCCGDQQQVLVPLAHMLARHGKRVLLLDEGLSAGMPHEALSTIAVHDLDDVLDETLAIEQVITPTAYRVDLIASGGRASTLTKHKMESRIRLLNAFYKLSGRYDLVLINTDIEALRHRSSFAWACQDVIVLCQDHHDSLTQSYAQIKSLHQAGESRFHLLFSSPDEVVAQAMFRRLAAVTRRHLKLMPVYLGVLSGTGELPAVVADQVIAWPLPVRQAGHFPALMRRLLSGSQSRTFVPH